MTTELPTDTVGAWVPHGRFTIKGAASGPLHGLRFGVKDLFDVAGHPTGAGQPTWLATHPLPTASHPWVDRLLAAGATLAGKLVTDELAYSIHGDNLHYGAPHNARAPLRVTGGSSSGSAAAVAAGLVDFALGTDTGGSTRVPASYCGLWGLRTTHDLLPGTGLVPLHPSFDTPTWLAHDAGTFERVGEVLLAPSDFVPRRLLRWGDAWAEADAVFQAPLERAWALLQRGLDAESMAVAPPEDGGLEAWRQTYLAAGAHEGWQVHGAWIEAHSPDFAPAVAARWQAARAVTKEAAATARAQGVRIRERVRALLGHDAIALLPSAASLAPLRDAPAAEVDLLRTRTMRITCIAGLAGLPQVSLPWPGAAEGEPLGLSLLGPAGSDLALIRLATALWRELAADRPVAS